MINRATLGAVLIAGAAAVALPAMIAVQRADAMAVNVPPASLVLPAQGNREVAVLAGGCFWGVEAVYEHVKGVIDVRSGYAGGSVIRPSYAGVSSGSTGHAEAVRITFDPSQVSYAELLRILFAVVADPTQVDRQGPDVGTQYRTAIFPQSSAQERVAKAYLAQLRAAHVFPRPIATKIEHGRFSQAEAYHQDFMRKNPNHPYIVVHDRPKVAALRQQFPAVWKG